MTREGRRARREPNRLRRRAQRLEHLAACLLGLLAVAAAVVAFAAGDGAYSSVSERARAEAATRTEVTAVLLSDARPVTRGGESAARTVPLHWTDRHGVDRTASVPVPGFHRAGDQVPVWTTDDGRVVAKPTSPVDATAAGILFGVMTAAVGGGVVHLAGRGLYAWTGRRFNRAWELEWERVGPEWTRGRRSEPSD